MSDTPKIPEGFRPPKRNAPFGQHAGPFVYKRTQHEDGRMTGEVGVFLEPHHVGGNNRGHGGLLLTILDEAMGMNAALARNSTPVVTVSMQTNFIAATEVGKFLRGEATVSQTTSSLAFMEGRAWCGDTLVGTASGVWKYLRLPPVPDDPDSTGNTSGATP